MAHFAELDQQNTVKRVIVVNNSELLDDNGNEVEQKGIDFCNSLFGGTWVQTSYNANFRKHFAGQGYRYNEDLDAFIPPQPYPSWLFDSETCTWSPPVAMPEDDKIYRWNEQSTSWDVVE